jgi:hypothetical protein
MQITRAQIKNGKIDFASPLALARFATWCAQNDGARVVIDLDKEDRSLSQLRMYRAWLANVAAHTGNDEEELHTFLLDKCAPRAVVKIVGPKGAVEVEQIKRTSGGHRLSMDKNEMDEYMRKCAQLTGYPLPTEEELLAMGYLPH